MNKIKISPIMVMNSTQILKQVTWKLSLTSGNLNTVNYALNREILTRRNIASRISRAMASLDRIVTDLKELESFSNRAISSYHSAETQLVKKASFLSNPSSNLSLINDFSTLNMTLGEISSLNFPRNPGDYTNKFYDLSLLASNSSKESITHSNGNNETNNFDEHWIKKQKGVLVGELTPEDAVGFYGNPLYYYLDIITPTSFKGLYHDFVQKNQIGGEAKFSVVNAGVDLGDIQIYEQLVALEAKFQYDSSGFQAKAGGVFQDLGIDGENWKTHLKIGNAEALAEIKDGHIAAGAKADLAKAEGEVKIDIPLLDLDFVLGGDLAFGSIGGEAKLGLQNELSLGLGLFGAGVKFGFEEEEDDEK